MKKFIILFSVLALSSINSVAYSWTNHMRDIFKDNMANIYVLNPRTFSAVDKNKNQIIDIELGEEPGTFIGAIKRLDKIAASGVNTIHLLPITPVGKLKALGTAGSLYAMDAFDKVNPQLDDKNNPMSVYEEAKLFIKEAHKRGIHVIIDLPSCGSYDMSLRRPELFVKNASGMTVTPADWSDVRLFKVVERDNSLNRALLDEHKKFVDMVQNLGADGIRADVATIKTYEFWRELINYARARDPQFLFLAEASPAWTTPVAKEAVFTPYDKLVSAGFDGYLGNFMNYFKFESTADLFKSYNEAKKLGEKFGKPASIILNFATHDDLSPSLINPLYPIQLVWLAATLPGNTYFVNGFTSGDTYIYPYANKEAEKTYTDNSGYYVHRGKLDIFNFSRQPGGQNVAVAKEFKVASRVKYSLYELLKTEPTILSTGNKQIFAYEYKSNNIRLIVIVNKNPYVPVSTVIPYKGINKYEDVLPLHYPEGEVHFNNGKIELRLEPADIAVFTSFPQEIKNIEQKREAQLKQYSQK